MEGGEEGDGHSVYGELKLYQLEDSYRGRLGKGERRKSEQE